MSTGAGLPGTDDTSYAASTAQPSTDAPVHRVAAAVALSVAVGLVALGSWGYYNPGDFVVVETLFDHVFVLGVIAALLTGRALGLLTRRRWLRTLLWVPAVIVACLWALVGAVVTLMFDWTEVVAELPAPDRPYSAVVTDVPATIPDPAWAISIRQTGSLTARELEVGCISGDDPQYTFRKATWTDAEHLSVKLARHTLTVRVDAATGKPFPVSGDAWNC